MTTIQQRLDKLTEYAKNQTDDTCIIVCDVCSEFDWGEEGKYCYHCKYQTCCSHSKPENWCELDNKFRDLYAKKHQYGFQAKKYTLSCCMKCKLIN